MAREIQLGLIEAKFADMVWEHEPVSSSELVKQAAVEFDWKRTTTHTVLRRLCDKGLFQNDNGIVKKVLTRQEFYAHQSKKYIDETFHGSLPAFIAAFTQFNSLSVEEVEEIKRMIDSAGED